MSLRDKPGFSTPYNPSQRNEITTIHNIKEQRPLSERLRDGTTIIRSYDPGPDGLPFDEWMKRALRGDFDEI